ncbi:hypothetical protein EVG20_g3866 [Dentipellis fragilis]|uniref:Uncharacterized protein n=1 Tax=Dentipellis fragilis TaxID=205917 RepID=A0A4Y9Z2S2_9AGAM|nr:hypothetical protein EVG20_g3866 [Dentipellis fragilis]
MHRSRTSILPVSLHRLSRFITSVASAPFASESVVEHPTSSSSTQQLVRDPLTTSRFLRVSWLHPIVYSPIGLPVSPCLVPHSCLVHVTLLPSTGVTAYNEDKPALRPTTSFPLYPILLSLATKATPLAPAHALLRHPLSAICTSRRAAFAFRARQNSILTAVCRNVADGEWPAVARFLIFKETGRLTNTEEDTSCCLLGPDAMRIYLKSVYTVSYLADEFSKLYAPDEIEPSKEQYTTIWRVLYRIWLYQARFGSVWRAWTYDNSDEPAPETDARENFINTFTQDERPEFKILYRWLMIEIGKRSNLEENDLPIMEWHALTDIAFQLPEIVTILESTYWESYTGSREDIDEADQFLPGGLPYDIPAYMIDCLEQHIFGDDCITRKSLSLPSIPRYHAPGLMGADFYTAPGFWGTLNDFIFEYLDEEICDICGILAPFKEGLMDYSYSYADICRDVLTKAHVPVTADRWTCTNCLHDTLGEWLTYCWIDRFRKKIKDTPSNERGYDTRLQVAAPDFVESTDAQSTCLDLPRHSHWCPCLRFLPSTFISTTTERRSTPSHTMWQRLPLDVLDRILTKVDDFNTLWSAIRASRHAAVAFRARPNSILTATTGKLADSEDEAVDAMALLGPKVVKVYLESKSCVTILATRFLKQYAPRKATPSTEQSLMLFRAFFRVWLYQVRFGPTWQAWFRHDSDEPAPELDLRLDFYRKFSTRERTEFLVVYRWIMLEIGMSSAATSNRNPWSIQQQHAEMNIATDMDYMSYIINGLWPLQTGERSDPTEMDQFLPDAPRYQSPTSIDDCLEESILGGDYITRIPCYLCNTVGEFVWNGCNWNEALGYFGTAAEFVERFLDDTLQSMPEFRDLLIGEIEGDYPYDMIFPDVLRMKGVSKPHDRWVCTSCMTEAIEEWLTFCWIRECMRMKQDSRSRRSPPSHELSLLIIQHLIEAQECSIASK